MGLFKRSEKKNAPGLSVLPRHVAIIMDGNGRWAQRRGLPRSAGHARGAETFKRIANYCKALGIEYLTVYAFSTENWKRSKEEVAAIMSLLEKYLLEGIESLQRDGNRLYVMGDVSELSPRLRELAVESAEISDHVKGFQANLCVNYGGRAEIVRAAERYAQDVKRGAAAELDEKAFSRYLYTRDIPDPDLVIRPSGELRISNFLLWQLAYSELYFTDTLWPDFDEREFDKALASYASRQRRFGAADTGATKQR